MLSIAYASKAVMDFSTDELASLLTNAREKNARLDITGALLYQDGQFVQVIEGPVIAVRNLYLQIAADSRHQHVQMVSSHSIIERQFPTWTMAFVPSVDAIEFLTDLDPAPANAAAEKPAPAISDPVEPAPGPGATPGSINQNPLPATEAANMFFNLHWNDLLAQREHLPGQPGGGTAAEPESENALLEGLGSTVTETGASAVVAAIFDMIINDVTSGSLLPGDRVSDGDLARRLGVSRTPVREAIQQLRAIGVVEVTSERRTQIAIVDAEQTNHAVQVILTLGGLLLEEIIGTVSESTIELMRADRAEFQYNLLLDDAFTIISPAVNFFMRLVAESRNPLLRRNIEWAVQPVKLGSRHLQGLIGVDCIDTAQRVMLAAAISGNLSEAKRSLAMMNPGGAGGNDPNYSI